MNKVTLRCFAAILAGLLSVILAVIEYLRPIHDVWWQSAAHVVAFAAFGIYMFFSAVKNYRNSSSQA